MKGYEIMTDAGKRECISMFSNKGYKSEVDISGATELEKGDAIVEVANVTPDEISFYCNQFRSNDSYVPKPRTVISARRTKARDLARQGLRDKPRHGIAEIGRILLEDFIGIRNSLIQGGARAHLYRTTTIVEADGKTSLRLETIR